MGFTFVGNVAVRDDDVVVFGNLRFWSERGIIHVESAVDNSYDSMSVRTALERMRSINDMLGNSSQRQQHSEDRYDQYERKRHQDMLDGLCVLVRRAQEQGTPDDASARRDAVRRRAKTFVMPASYGGGL